jgi:type IV fimbrial biogenesis protein FimT
MQPAVRSTRGFTVIELMITLLIIAILAAIGVPSWRDTIQNNRVTGGTNNLVTALNLARSESVRRSIPVAVCGTDNPNAVPASCNITTTWSNGWIVFTDDTGTAGERDNADVVLQVWPGVGGNVIALASAAFARYDVSGMMTSGNLTFRIGTSGCTGNKVGQTLVSTVGSIRSTKVACPP